MSTWLNQFQHVPDNNMIIIGLLEQKTYNFSRMIWTPQIEGSKTTAEIPSILDDVISLLD